VRVQGEEALHQNKVDSVPPINSTQATGIVSRQHGEVECDLFRRRGIESISEVPLRSPFPVLLGKMTWTRDYCEQTAKDDENKTTNWREETHERRGDCLSSTALRNSSSENYICFEELVHWERSQEQHHHQQGVRG
jgi:hypothetical protein